MLAIAAPPSVATARAADRTHPTTPVHKATAENTSYRFVVPPQVLFERTNPVVDSQIQVVVRLNRPLPRTKRGVRGAITVNDNGDVFGRPFTITHQHPCYRSDFPDLDNSTDDPVRPIPGLENPTDGQPVTVALWVRGHKVLTTRVPARASTYSEMNNETKEHARYRKLGCIR